ncbi:DNA polymerase epsilon subunit 3-like [Contarinia nasturtii]|uniref:DNA polymerase epsilon subunit 3-like n=1 Tax=Contarinia nasturtii TaxID=265458 RepID=UPI0012D4BEB4|nr:DNA polymerase epsilon subunit 3-like [Contarinia nasturtii]
MVDKIQDLNLPATVVTRLIKDALPDGINVGKEARSAIARAASIFIIYLTSSTAAAARKQKHKSLSSDNVFAALEEIEFENFIDPLREALDSFRKTIKEKKSSKTNDSKTNNDANTEEEMDEVNGSTAHDESSLQEPSDGTENEE